VLPATHRAYNRTRKSELAPSLTIADTFWSRFMGLMGKKADEFRPGQSLWINPCQGVHMFFMRLPLDIVYLDKKNVVLQVVENLRPWRIGKTVWKAASVLELPVGTVQKSDTQVGDVIEISRDEK
jgi:uncharacterized membrane protein (UPF0127 family)